MEALRRLAESRRLPAALALAAVLLMLPALPIGLFGDDLLQRPIQFPAAKLPPAILQTGLVAPDSGALRSVMKNQFGYLRDAQSLRQAKEYGIIPWWASDNLRLYLWRPLTAFTHWLDYRLWPDRPVLMHAENALWFATAVFLAAGLYRRMAAPTGLMAAGLAGFLYLLDKDTFGPTAYVANRGFFLALVCGLLCWHAHVRWRAEESNRWMWLSMACLALSLLANEGGASTLSFLIAYALVIEPRLGVEADKSRGLKPTVMRCALSLLPAAIVVICWRAVYIAGGFGVRHLSGYVDPGYSPLLFARHLVVRLFQTLGGQLTGIPPELTLALNERWQWIACLFFAGVSLLCALAFLPILRRDSTARLWAFTALFALIPASTVTPLSKNLAFVAVGAFGVIAPFLIYAVGMANTAPLRILSRCAAVFLLIIHVGGALACRAGLALLCRSAPEMIALAQDYGPSLDINGKDIVLINDPTSLSILVPFYRAYQGTPLPRSTHILVPGSVPMSVRRTDESTLVVSTLEGDLFGCRDLGPIHASYAAKAADDLFFTPRVWKSGQQTAIAGFTVEILESTPQGAPRSIAFHFPKPLDSTSYVWLTFDWSRLEHVPFTLPPVGQSAEIAGPHVNLAAKAAAAF